MKKIDRGQTIQIVANVGVIVGIVIVALMLGCSRAGGQQVRDTSFRFENTNPAFPSAAGPVVCIDEAHNNFHTADGRYRAFAELLREDGYRVEGFGGKFDPKELLNCSILVSANPGEVGMDDAYPHPSAFTRDDISELVKWVRGGKSLLLIIDHSPVPGAAADLGIVLWASICWTAKLRVAPKARLPPTYSSLRTEPSNATQSWRGEVNANA